MGQWSLDRLTTHSSALNGPIFGTNFHAVFHLRYTTSTLGSYKETPKLDWHETIMMNEHHNHRSWTFDTNMYQHNPTSQTLIVWARRYIESYRAVAGLGSGVQKGKAELRALNGGPVTIEDLGANLNNAGQQADAVRSYLRRRGGLLILEIHDVPGINAPTGAEHKERLLLFDVGVEGLPLRSKAEQYLNVRGGVLPANWQREFNHNAWQRSRLNTTGLTKAAPPPLVANPRQPLFGAGECW